MSILIKSMEMPTSCVECPCCRHDNWNGETAHQCNVSFITFGAEDENWIYNTRPNWCPLVEIPPHEEQEVKPIGYKECADAMLKMWMDDILTDGEYNKIMDKLNETVIAEGE